MTVIEQRLTMVLASGVSVNSPPVCVTNCSEMSLWRLWRTAVSRIASCEIVSIWTTELEETVVIGSLVGSMAPQTTFSGVGSTTVSTEYSSSDSPSGVPVSVPTGLLPDRWYCRGLVCPRQRSLTRSLLSSACVVSFLHLRAVVLEYIIRHLDRFGDFPGLIFIITRKETTNIYFSWQRNSIPNIVLGSLAQPLLKVA